MAEEIQRESTLEDYFNVVNPVGISYNNPQTRYNIANDFEERLDVEDPVFKASFDSSNIDTQRAMLNATSVNHALKVKEKRGIFEDSAKAVQQDSLVTQFALGAVPAMLDPTMLVGGPLAGAASTAFKTANAATRLSRAGRVAGAGAVAGASANLVSEVGFAAQDLQHDYLSSLLFGAAFGGTLGGIAGALSGPNGKGMANNMTDKTDTFATDFRDDPNLIIDTSSGIPKIVGAKARGGVAQMDKNLLDRIPLVGKFLRSDVNTVYQSDSQALRTLMTKVSPSTIAARDASGNPVPIGFTGADHRRQTDGLHNELNYNLSQTFESARVEGFKGSRDEFISGVSEVYVAAARDQEKAAYIYAQQKMNSKLAKMAPEDIKPEKIQGDFEKHLDDYYTSNKAEFKSENPAFIKGAENYRTYYNNMLNRGQGVGVNELAKINPNRLYRPRVYDFKTIHSGKYTPEEIRTRVHNALAAHPNQADLKPEQLSLAAQELTTKLTEGAFDLNFLTSSFVVPKELPFGTMLKARKWKLDETQLGDLLKTNLDDVTGAYHYKMRGRQAVAYSFGTDDIAEVTAKLRDEMVNEGNLAAKEEINAFERIVRDLVGELRMNQLSDTPKWTWTRNLSTINTTRLGGGFGGNQFIELGGNMFFSGVSNMLNSGRFSNSFQNAGKLLYTKTPVDDSFTKTLMRSGYMQDALHTSRINRYADTEQGFNSGILENKLNWAGDKLMKWNGMRYFMGVMEDMTGGAIVDQISVLAKKDTLTPTELTRITRWGLKPKDIKALASDIELHTNLKEGKFDLDKFSESNQDLFQLAISRGIDEAVIQGDSIHLPNWMKAPQPILRLMTQFMRFPMIANEVLLRKGMREEQARMASAVIASTVTYMGLKYVREQAGVQLGLVDEMDTKYDYFGNKGEEARNKALLESLNYNASLGMMSTLWNAGAVATGNPELGRDYVTNNQAEAFFGPTFGGMLPDMLSLTKSLAEGDFDEKTANKLKSYVPFNNLPIIHEGLRALNEESF